MNRVATAGSQRDAAAPATILVVDDDQTMCEAMELTLSRRDLEITWRTSVEDALELVAERDFDAILTDMTMPTMSGIDFCERIHAIRPDVPVVVVTGHNRADCAVSALRAGAFDFIVKPVDGQVLALAVDRAVRHRRVLDELKQSPTR